jgi:hypothetical protein
MGRFERDIPMRPDHIVTESWDILKPHNNLLVHDVIHKYLLQDIRPIKGSDEGV